MYWVTSNKFADSIFSTHIHMSDGAVDSMRPVAKLLRFLLLCYMMVVWNLTELVSLPIARGSNNSWTVAICRRLAKGSLSRPNSTRLVQFPWYATLNYMCQFSVPGSSYITIFTVVPHVRNALYFWRKVAHINALYSVNALYNISTLAATASLVRT